MYIEVARQRLDDLNARFILTNPPLLILLTFKASVHVCIFVVVKIALQPCESVQYVVLE